MERQPNGSVVHGLLKLNQGNWLLVSEKLKKEFGSSHVDFVHTQFCMEEQTKKVVFEINNNSLFSVWILLNFWNSNYFSFFSFFFFLWGGGGGEMRGDMECKIWSVIHFDLFGENDMPSLLKWRFTFRNANLKPVNRQRK